MSNESNDKIVKFRQSIQEALDRSERELEQIASFFHQHGYTEQAKKIYSAILTIRQDRKNTSTGGEHSSTLLGSGEKQNDGIKFP